MYPPRFIQYINLPPVPDEIIKSISLDPNTYETKILGVDNPKTYSWSDHNNQLINQWGQENICKDMYFAYQFMTGNVTKHKDKVTKTKLLYLISPGGSKVMTSFYSDDGNTLLDSYQIEPFRWHIFKADSVHEVMGVEPGNVRFSINAKLF